MHKKGGKWKLKQHCKSAENCKAAKRLLYMKEAGVTPKGGWRKPKSELEKVIRG